jgi:hypothetical protein
MADFEASKAYSENGHLMGLIRTSDDQPVAHGM